MKKIILIFLVVACFTTTYGQETAITIPEINKETYLQKSKKQKRTAWIFLGTGCLATVLGAIQVNPNYGESTNQAFLFIGGLVMIGASVTLFNSSARNKRRGMSMSLRNNIVPHRHYGDLSFNSVVSISLMVSF